MTPTPLSLSTSQPLNFPVIHKSYFFLQFSVRLAVVSYFLIPTCSFALASDPPITQDELVRRTQELYDSLVPGNQAPWKKYFADDCTFSDEKGRTFDKQKLVADIAPLPKGYSGAIKIDNVISRIIGDTAVLSYDADETETVFGQKLRARYHITDTWLRRNGQWQIIASQAHRYYEDPAVGKADETKFGGYVGTYELAPGQTRTVSVENGASRDERHGRKSREVAVERSGELSRYNGKLFIERTGKKEELLPEASDIFFRKNVEGRILFHYDANGKIDTLIDRRNNEDVIWKKVK
jgi:Domain of unknown function (DUF4440)